MIAAPQVYRASMSPFRSTSSGIYSVVGDLAPKGFLPHQFCLVGTPQAIANVASSINPSSPIRSQFSYLVGDLQGVHAPNATVPLVASAGPISDVLLKDESWLSSSAVKPLQWHLENGDVVLAVNGLDHDQYVDASRLLLRHGDGNVLTFIFRWPTNANP